MIDQDARDWNLSSLNEHFFPRDVELIKKNKHVLSSPDFKWWMHNKSGEYSVKSGYWLASRAQNEEAFRQAAMLPSLNGIKEQIWKLSAPSKIKIFIWKAMCGAIPMAERLNTRGMEVDQRCHLCGLEGESINNVLFTCSLSCQIWALSSLPLPEDGFDPRSIYQNLHHVLLMCKNFRVPIEVRRSPPWILWSLWKNRNSLFFEGLVSSPIDILQKFKEDSQEWFQAQVIENHDDVLKPRLKTTTTNGDLLQSPG